MSMWCQLYLHYPYTELGVVFVVMAKLELCSEISLFDNCTTINKVGLFIYV